MPCTIRPQTVTLTSGLKLEFIEERHMGNGAPAGHGGVTGERSTSVLIVTHAKDGTRWRLRFDAQGELVTASMLSVPPVERADAGMGELGGQGTTGLRPGQNSATGSTPS